VPGGADKQQRGPRRVLVVSDDPLFVQATTIGFRVGGEFQVFHCPAARPAPASAIAEAGRDAVLFDDSGVTDEAFDLVRDVCAQTGRPPVVVLSRLADPARENRMLELGATAIVSRAMLNGALVSFVRELSQGRLLVRPTPRAPAPAQTPPARLIVAA